MKIKTLIDRPGIVVDEEKTSSTIFLLPSLEIPKDHLTMAGFVNAYLSDQEHDVEYKNCIYLLFKPNNIDYFNDIVKYIETYHKIHDVYDIEKGYVMLVVKFPTDYLKEYRHFKLGKYSKFSKKYISKFFPFKKVVAWDSKGKPSKEEYTLFYHIFNKTEWLKEWWAKRLGYTNMNEFELEEWWDIPSDKKEIFRYKKN